MSGVFKDIGLIVWSVLVSGAVVTELQYVGYAVALAGVTGYSSYKRAEAAAKLAIKPIDTTAEERGEQEEKLGICTASALADAGSEPPRSAARTGT